MTRRRIMFAGGGTGGHLFPAFALAEEFVKRLGEQCEIRFFVTGRDLEMRLIGERGYPAHRIHIRGIRRGSVMGNLLFPIMLCCGIMESIYHILRVDPDFVVGTGGYLSFPAVLAARITNRPAFIQEQNSYAGIATRKLARFADRIFIAYEDTARQLQFVEKCILTGNPIRAHFGQVEREAACRQFGLDPDKRTLLIFGGSQGAASINRKILKSLENLAAIERLQLIWQVGGDIDCIEKFNKSSLRGVTLKFIDDMPAAYAAADLVICRAGALTLSELTASAKPAILIPYPYATEDHQTKNAQTLVDAGAATMIRDAQLPEIDLPQVIEKLLTDENKLLSMSMASGALGRRDAAENIVQRILEFMGWQ
ncbi:MAG: undecaprenyldiphospho-muramoylpentapeptide beta-N-acetylglucosaminyltransferase [candidate division Zixibacteria bacterium]|nr:undecaprenyldiphospho-muramoylpentapeptide beta-N-acetylglucosaminyltransferase [candidate division Zixibacteria bacterium]